MHTLGTIVTLSALQKLTLWMIGMLIPFSGCQPLHCENPGRIVFPKSPVNLAGLNSPYDDWNCGASWDTWESGSSFLFSTNRATSGSTFDVYPTAIRFEGDDGFTMDTVPPAAWVLAVANRINTAQDELGPTFFFHSNRDGKYGIYQAIIPLDSMGIIGWLSTPKDSDVRVSRIPELTSDGEERCPFIIGNDLYFVSNRSGGLGRFDIYKSAWTGTAWSTPENLGPAINSGSDEYRPLAFHLYPDVDALFFSSNRPGGKGGYDLYATSLTPKT